MMSLPSASGELFSIFIVCLHTMQFIRPIRGLLSSFKCLVIFLNGSLSVFALRRTAKTVRFRALAIVSTLFALRTSARSCLSCSGVQGARGVPVISPSPPSSSSTQPPGVLSSPKVDASRIPHSGNCQISLAVPHAFPFASGFPRGRSRSSASTPGCEQRIWCAAFALRSRPCLLRKTRACEGAHHHLATME